jgi:hypothetical protein
LIKKIIILGIVALAVIALAVMPSPGNFLHPPVENKLAGASQSTETAVQMPAQNGPTSGAAIEPANQTSTQPVTQPTIETVPKPVYTNVTLVPENVVVTVNQTFKVEIWVNNVTDMAGWQIDLLWNKEIIKCVEAQVNTPPEWGGVGFDLFNKTEADVNLSAVYTAWLFGSGIESDYSDTSGRYFKAECFGPYGGDYHNTFNGTIRVVTLTFQALQAGSSLLDFAYTEIGNRNASPIGHLVNDGSVEVQAQ